jgi:hypothetical protein
VENERITWIAQDGVVTSDIKAIKSDKGFRVVRDDLDFREGEFINRPLPNGRVEEYIIMNVKFTNKIHNISGSFLLEVRRKDKPLEQATPQIVTYNLHGNNSRVNVNSLDHSHNMVGLSAEDVFAGIELAVSGAVEDEIRKKEILSALQIMKSEAGKPGFIKRYTEFMSTLADTITVVTPFLPALAQMLPT